MPAGMPALEPELSSHLFPGTSLWPSGKKVNVAYRQDGQERLQIRTAYERALGLFSEREVTYKRVVNVVERRSASPYDTQRYGGSRSYQDHDLRGYHGKNTYTGSNSGSNTGSNTGRYYGESSHYSSVRRNTSPPRKEESYSYYRGSREDGPAVRQVEMSRSSSRAGSVPSSGGPGLGPPSRTMSPGFPDRAESRQNQEPVYLDRREEREDPRWRDVYTGVRDRSHSPTRRGFEPPSLPPVETTTSSRRILPPLETTTSSRRILPPLETTTSSRSLPPVESTTSNRSLPPVETTTSSRSYSPDRENAFSYQQLQQRRYEDVGSQNREPDNVNPRLPSPCVALEEGPVKDAPPGPVAEAEEVEALNQELAEDLKTRRSLQIATKALEIEKLYMQDCETFSTVVKMLVDRAPSLDQMLEAPLKENLTAIKERCLDDLKRFIRELDQGVSSSSES